MRFTRIVPAILLLPTFLFVTLPLSGQSVYGRVSGRLVSASGSPVSGASVSLTSTATGASIQTQSDVSGYITIANLAADLYQIEVRAEGFKRVQGTVAVSADETTTLNAALPPGDPNELAKSEAGLKIEF